MYNAITIEERNTPTVALVNKDFVSDARSAALIKGMPGVRTVIETVPCECTIEEDIESGISAVIDDIVAALISPLTTEEKSELDHYIQLEHLMRLAKARARRHLAHE